MCFAVGLATTAFFSISADALTLCPAMIASAAREGDTDGTYLVPVDLDTCGHAHDPTPAPLGNSRCRYIDNGLGEYKFYREARPIQTPVPCLRIKISYFHCRLSRDQFSPALYFSATVEMSDAEGAAEQSVSFFWVFFLCDDGVQCTVRSYYRLAGF